MILVGQYYCFHTSSTIAVVQRSSGGAAAESVGWRRMEADHYHPTTPSGVKKQVNSRNLSPVWDLYNEQQSILRAIERKEKKLARFFLCSPMHAFASAAGVRELSALCPLLPRPAIQPSPPSIPRRAYHHHTLVFEGTYLFIASFQRFVFQNPRNL